MPELDADFEISTNNLEAEYEITQSEHFDCSFEIYASGTTFSSITGSPYDNEALTEALNQKADNSTVESLSETVTNNYNTLDGKIDTHIADKTNPHEVTKTQVGLGNVDNTSDLNKPISTATQTALNGKQNTINDLSEIRTNASNGQSAYNTIQTYGDIVTYDASNFATSIQGQKADTALQPNDDITKLNNNAGYITSADVPTVNNSTITFQKNNVTVGDINLNQPNNETINFDIPTTASDVNALPDTTTINDLTTTAQQNAIDSGANTSNIGQIATNTSNISSLTTTVTNNYNTLDGRITSEVSTLNTAIGTETTNRQNADNNLQSQIDAIVSSSDVFDIVGTYAELEAYNISTVPVNDIIKVLVDSTHSNAATYYRCVENNNVKSWSYIGSEGAYYTKSEANSLFVEQTTTVNGKALSNNITLTASDVGALPDNTVIPTVNNGTLTIQQNGTDVQTFGANQSSNVTANITVPTDTNDLTNGAGFITNSALSGYATTTDLTNGLATKQDTISDLSTIRSNATNGQSAYTTIGGYGDIVTYNASNFVQKNGDSSTQTISLTSGTGTTALGIKSMATSSYISLSGSSGWLGSYGVSSSKRAVFYNGTGYTLAYTSEIPTNTSELTNDSGYITGINSSDVTTALGYTPYDSTNPAGYTSNVGTVTSVNNTQPDVNGNVTISVSGGANTDLSNLTATGEAHFQEPLVSGINIKTVNSTSLLGSGDISVGSYSAGTGLSLSGTTFNHSNSVTAGTIGTSSATSGSTISVPYATYDAQGHITSKGTHTHTVTGFLTSSSTQVASSRFDGQWVTSYSSHSWSSKGSYTISLSGYLPSDRTSYSYYIYVVTGASRGSSNGVFRVGTVASPATNTTTAGNYSIGGYMTSNSTGWYGSAIIPVAPSGSLYSELTVAMSNAYCYLIGYRRIGTNT